MPVEPTTRVLTWNRCAPLAGVCALMLASASHAGAIDLSSWSVENATGADWMIDPGGGSATQMMPGGASRSVLMSDFSTPELHLAGSVSVNTALDDDFLGFVFGFDHNEIGDAGADYLVLDWKQGSQITNFWGPGIFAESGMALSRVTGDTSGAQGDIDAWTHTGAYAEIDRSAALGATGWQDSTSYDFEIIYSEQRLEVWVSWMDDGGAFEVKAIDYEAGPGETLPTGHFGFYSFSQEQTEFSGWRTVPSPGSTTLAAIAGTVIFFRRRNG